MNSSILTQKRLEAAYDVGVLNGCISETIGLQDRDIVYIGRLSSSNCECWRPITAENADLFWLLCDFEVGYSEYMLQRRWTTF